MTGRAPACGLCASPASGVCPRCDQPLCAAHEVRTRHCAGCEALVEARVRRGTPVRMAVVAAAAVGGMVGGAVAILVAATAIGLGPEIMVLLMLLAELGLGVSAAVAADRRMHERLRARALRELGSVPSARLLPGRAE